MSNERPSQPDWTGFADRLSRDSEAMPWPERRTLVQAACEHMAEVGPSEPVVSLLTLLANDPKWEVRKDVADGLLLVPEEVFPRLAAQLVEDSNRYVQSAAERALDRRRRGRQSVERKRRELDQVQDQYVTIERQHGAGAAEKARQMAERLYDVLVGATVHDMRNILAPLKSGIQALQGHAAEGNFDGDLFRTNLARMAYQAAMLERWLDDMRFYAQPTPAERRRERLVDIVNESHGIVLDAFRAYGRDPVSVRMAIDVSERLTVDVARHQFVRAVTNVIKNAYEAFAADPQTFGEGEILVCARLLDDERLELVVEDKGMGMSPEELDDVRRFVPGGTSKKTHGTGWGLPTAKRKVEDHDGSLAIDSTEDVGTVVTITLPMEGGGGI
ncbi:MAG TPA: ATP-binding protein [Phycisphaerae bacterium]|nr:ATP-binding protein [Phycisphaerae bacterium]